MPHDVFHYLTLMLFFQSPLQIDPIALNGNDD
jgi:hypothetical protein